MKKKALSCSECIHIRKERKDGMTECFHFEIHDGFPSERGYIRPSCTESYSCPRYSDGKKESFIEDETPKTTVPLRDYGFVINGHRKNQARGFVKGQRRRAANA